MKDLCSRVGGRLRARRRGGGLRGRASIERRSSTSEPATARSRPWTTPRAPGSASARSCGAWGFAATNRLDGPGRGCGVARRRVRAGRLRRRRPSASRSPRSELRCGEYRRRLPATRPRCCCRRRSRSALRAEAGLHSAEVRVSEAGVRVAAGAPLALFLGGHRRVPGAPARVRRRHRRDRDPTAAGAELPSAHGGASFQEAGDARLARPRLQAPRVAEEAIARCPPHPVRRNHHRVIDAGSAAQPRVRRPSDRVDRIYATEAAYGERALQAGDLGRLRWLGADGVTADPTTGGSGRRVRRRGFRHGADRPRGCSRRPAHVTGRPPCSATGGGPMRADGYPQPPRRMTTSI
jgi:hypothetical protein